MRSAAVDAFVKFYILEYLVLLLDLWETKLSPSIRGHFGQLPLRVLRRPPGGGLPGGPLAEDVLVNIY